MAAAVCSFCGKAADEVDYLVAGPRGVAICDECAALVHEVAAEALRPLDEGVVLTGLSRLFTNDGRHGEPVGEVRDWAVVARRGIITWLGPEADLPARYEPLGRVGCGGRAAVPGFVDASVRHGLASGVDTGGLTRRLHRMLVRGITAVDLRLGDSADPAGDVEALAAGTQAAGRLPLTATLTWVVGDMHVDEIAGLRPTVAELAAAAEVECHGGGIDHEAHEVRPLALRVRPCRDGADGCAGLARRSVDGPGEVEGAPDGVMRVLEAAPVLSGGRLPARRLWDGGRRCAIGSGSGPAGAAPEGPGLAMAAGVGLGGLSVGEALWSVTRGGALAIGDAERGRLRLGAPADLVVLDADDPAELVARPDGNAAWKVLVGGSFLAD